MRWVSIVCMKVSGSKPGSTVSEPPFSSVGVKKAAPAWESGVQIKKRTSSGHCHSDSWIMVMAAPPRLVLMIPLGLPVVPPE